MKFNTFDDLKYIKPTENGSEEHFLSISAAKQNTEDLNELKIDYKQKCKN